MNGFQLERVLTSIDTSIPQNMDAAHEEILSYLRQHEVEIAGEIKLRGSASIPTRFGPVIITREDLAVPA